MYISLICVFHAFDVGAVFNVKLIARFLQGFLVQEYLHRASCVIGHSSGTHVKQLRLTRRTRHNTSNTMNKVNKVNTVNTVQKTRKKRNKQKL